MARRRGGAKGRRLPKVLKRGEWEKVIDGAGEDRREPLLALRDQAIIALFFFSGIRCFELVALDVADLDLEAGMVHVRHGKGDKERHAAVGPEALDLVEAYLDVRPDPKPGSGDPLFVSRKGGRLDTSAVRRLAKAAGTKGEHPDFHCHRARHSHATRLVEQGHNLFAVADQLGHEDLETTRIYTHISSQERQRMVRDM